MYLVDTNVISEARKGMAANPGVQAFFRAHRTPILYLSVQTVGEIRRGIENVQRRGERSRAALLEEWLGLIVKQYADHILDFDADCAQVWGKLMSPDGANPVDKQIAAIALIYDLEIVTRNVHDFLSTGARVFNPFD